MANRNDKRNIKDERIEDTTLYGEFISSFDKWVTPDRQREIARHLEEVSEILSVDDEALKKDKKRSR